MGCIDEEQVCHAGTSLRQSRFQFVLQKLGLRGGVFRHGQRLVLGGSEPGVVTSGGFSPTLNTSIGMGYLPRGAATPGSEVGVDVRGKVMGARVVARPFVRPTS